MYHRCPSAGARAATEKAHRVPDELLLSLRCGGLWDGPRPTDPQKFLAQLPAELARLRDYGASLIEFKAEVCAFDRRYCTPEVWERVANCVRDNGLGATVHLPAAWVDLAALDHELWEGSVRSVEVALRATAPLEPKFAAVHPAGDATGEWIRTLPEADRQTAVELIVQRVTDGLRRLRELPDAGPLSLENLEGTPCDLIALIAGRADVGICLDVGHVVSSGEQLVKALDAGTPRLRGIHLHDAKPPSIDGGRGKAHLPLGAGVLNLETLLTELRGRRFRGPVVLEVKGEFAESAARFLDAIRPVT